MATLTVEAETRYPVDDIVPVVPGKGDFTRGSTRLKGMRRAGLVASQADMAFPDTRLDPDDGGIETPSVRPGTPAA